MAMEITQANSTASKFPSREEGYACNRALAIASACTDPISRQTDVSLSLAKRVMANNNKSNFVFSPLCMHNVLGMLAVGSRGHTQNEVLSFSKSMWVGKLLSLHGNTMDFAQARPFGGPCLSFANGLFADQSLQLSRRHGKTLESLYKAASDFADFQNKADETTRWMNAWVDEKTNGRIKDLIPPGSVDSTARLVLANALHFKGAWSEKFDASLTKYGPFFLSDGSSVQVPYMSSYGGKQYFRAFDDFKVLRLPYKHGDKDDRRFSMFLFLPDAEDGLPALLEKFGSISGFIQGHLPREPVEVRGIRVPKFRINSGFEASQVFKKHGLGLPFSSPSGLTRMVRPDVGVSAVFHKSAIEVDEDGEEEEEVALSTPFSVGGCEEGLDFVAEHPFLFVVREDVSGVVFLVGQVVSPLAH